jgi:hypothetical protein
MSLRNEPLPLDPLENKIGKEPPFGYRPVELRISQPEKGGLHVASNRGSAIVNAIGKIRVAKLQRIRETIFRAFTQNLATRVIEKTTLGVANES